MLPEHEAWERAGRLPRSLFRDAGALGLLGFPVPVEYGGPGVDDFRYNAVLDTELNRSGAASAAVGLSLQNDVVLPYLTLLATPEQQRRWLPGVVTGDTVLAIAMTEPGTGSDLSAIGTRATRDGEHYVVNGAKTFVSNAERRPGDRRGAYRGRPAPGPVPARRRAGHPGLRPRSQSGKDRAARVSWRSPTPGYQRPTCSAPRARASSPLVANLPQERLALALGAVAAAEGVFAHTLDYVRDRKAFGQPIGSFQANRFALAELATELDIARTFVEDCLRQHLGHQLSPARAAMVKWWTSELLLRVADRCLQLHGGYGYMREYAVSRAFVDARISTIYGGTTEIMKEIIGRDLGL